MLWRYRKKGEIHYSWKQWDQEKSWGFKEQRIHPDFPIVASNKPVAKRDVFK
jgi:hypothetical protein